MTYYSSSDLYRTLLGARIRWPQEIDLVIAGDTESWLAASTVAQLLDVPLTDLQNADRHQLFRRRTADPAGWPYRHALVVSLTPPAERVPVETLRAAGVARAVTSVAVFAPRAQAETVDMALCLCEESPLFEWNLMSAPVLGQACVDIDGVLCLDPTPDENDDGACYQRFLAEARPLYRPTVRIHHLVTSRLERYRELTERWLAGQGIQHDRLSMIDLPDARTRRRLGAHGSFKADVYRRDEKAKLFIESETPQARLIAHVSGKPVICLADHRLYQGGIDLEPRSRSSLRQRLSRWWKRRVAKSQLPASMPMGASGPAVSDSPVIPT